MGRRRGRRRLQACSASAAAISRARATSSAARAAASATDAAAASLADRACGRGERGGRSQLRGGLRAADCAPTDWARLLLQAGQASHHACQLQLGRGGSASAEAGKTQRREPGAGSLGPEADAPRARLRLMRQLNGSQPLLALVRRRLGGGGGGRGLALQVPGLGRRGGAGVGLGRVGLGWDASDCVLTGSGECGGRGGSPSQRWLPAPLAAPPLWSSAPVHAVRARRSWDWVRGRAGGPWQGLQGAWAASPGRAKAGRVRNRRLRRAGRARAGVRRVAGKRGGQAERAPPAVPPSRGRPPARCDSAPCSASCWTSAQGPVILFVRHRAPKPQVRGPVRRRGCAGVLRPALRARQAPTERAERAPAAPESRRWRGTATQCAARGCATRRRQRRRRRSRAASSQGCALDSCRDSCCATPRAPRPAESGARPAIPGPCCAPRQPPTGCCAAMYSAPPEASTEGTESRAAPRRPGPT